ncbi:MAG: Ppx/GppA phosphatase family protein [Armatimonadaceae bacterium]
MTTEPDFKTTTSSSISSSQTDAPELPRDPNVIAALDIGTNSIRLSVVRLNTDTCTWTPLAQYKETVRLGQGEFATGDTRAALSDEAMSRGALVLSQFAEIARAYGASEIIAIATAALREAANREEFLERARDWAGVELQVVSGVEEARLIYLGVSSGIELGERKGLFIDIGGGSTEIIVGNQSEHFFLDSLKLGAIRLGNLYLEGVTGAIPDSLFGRMQQHVRRTATHTLRRVREIGFDLGIASSGTATNLAKVAAHQNGEDLTTLQNYVLRTSDLLAVVKMLRGMTLEERRKVPGLNPERADIIISGSAVLLTLVEALNLDSLTIAERSLREGVLVDALLRRIGAEGGFESGVRRRSVEHLARFNEQERDHAGHVARLALSLFDQFREQGLIFYATAERELLEYAALLHDIGVAVARSGHHRHSYYIIRHAELAGFTDEEIELIANLAYFHRKSPPKKRHTHFQALSREQQQMVRQLSVLLRIAEGLDRSHLGLVRGVRVWRKGKRVVIQLDAETEPQMELWYVEQEAAVFEEAFEMPMTVIGVGKEPGDDEEIGDGG